MLKHPANFVSALPIFAVGGKGDWVASEENDSAQYVVEIEGEMARAGALYRAQRYGEALEAYKIAQARIYGLLYPKEWIRLIAVRESAVLPLSGDITRKIAESSLELVENIRPSLTRPVSPVIVKPPDVAPLTEAGFTVSEAVAEVESALETGAALIRRGQGEEALEVLGKVKESPVLLKDKSLAGSVALNTSTALILTGAGEEATVSAERAVTIFREVDDEAGVAHALHNKGVALFLGGDTSSADEAFASSVKIISGVDGVQDGMLLAEGLDLGRRKAVVWMGEGGDAAAVSVADQASADWGLAIATLGGSAGEIKWEEGARPPVEAVFEVLKKRQDAREIIDLILVPTGPFETAAFLGHLYSFAIPQAIGDCYRALGSHTRAEEYYLDAAAYEYVNPELEAPGLWVRLAENALEWGDRLYRQEREEECRAVYGRVIGADGAAPPDSPLFTTASLAGPAEAAKTAISALGAEGATGNPAIELPLLGVWQRWQYLNAELDFWGTPKTPLFTFEYLQQVARGFAEQAIHAEREYVNFQNQAEAERATRRELEGALALADAEVDSRVAQRDAARAEAAMTATAVEMAEYRQERAKTARTEYQGAGYWQYVSQSMAAAAGGGDDWNNGEIRKLAADIEGGHAAATAGKAAAAASLLGGQKSFEFQLARMEDHIAEAEEGLEIAKKQVKAAEARKKAAEVAEKGARMRRELAREAIAAFEAEVFTPELWSRMAETMRGISADYQEWAIRSARIMERAYNFEADAELRVIKNEYPAHDTGGLLGSDELLRDVDSFTWQQVARVRAKEAQLKQTISLVNDLPFSFYELQRDGKTSFGTMLRDFEQAHPGFHSQRVQAVEVEIVGLLPPGGPRGVLRGGGTSRYRSADGEERVRVHGVDTLALSDHDIRGDAFLFRADPRLHGLFEGHGLASNWELELPKRSNAFDFGGLSDIRITFHYSAQFDPGLRDSILGQQPLPGELVHVRNFLAKYDFQEAWYSLLGEGTLRFTLEPRDLPRNETDFKAKKLALTLIGDGQVDLAGVEIGVRPPGKPRVTLTTGAAGTAAAAEENALEGAMGGELLGEWEVDVKPPEGSALLGEGGGLRSEVLRNLALVFEYSFAWPG